MTRRLVVALVLLMTSCAPPAMGTLDTNPGEKDSTDTPNIRVWHDDKRGATCWILGNDFDAGRTMSCLWDKPE